MTTAEHVRLLVGIGLAGAVIILAVMFVASITIMPMVRNYKECGTVFLCAISQHPSKP